MEQISKADLVPRRLTSTVLRKGTDKYISDVNSRSLNSKTWIFITGITIMDSHFLDSNTIIPKRELPGGNMELDRASKDGQKGSTEQ